MAVERLWMVCYPPIVQAANVGPPVAAIPKRGDRLDVPVAFDNPAGHWLLEDGENSVLTPRTVDGLFTGLHEPTASHFALLQAFAPRAQLDAAYAHAERGGYLGHELGDTNLIL